MENSEANSLRKGLQWRYSLPSFLLSQVTEGAYSSLYAAGNAFQRVEKEFFAEPFGARGRERKEDLAFLFTVDDACFTREGTVCGEFHLSLILSGSWTNVS